MTEHCRFKEGDTVQLAASSEIILGVVVGPAVGVVTGIDYRLGADPKVLWLNTNNMWTYAPKRLRLYDRAV